MRRLRQVPWRAISRLLVLHTPLPPDWPRTGLGDRHDRRPRTHRRTLGQRRL